MTNDYDVKITCCSCGKEESVHVKITEYEKWRNGAKIQQAMPKMHPMLRDVLITNMCLDCLSKTYNTPKPGEDWGEQLGNCECCDAPIWKRHIVEGISTYTCPLCGETMDLQQNSDNV